MQEINCQDQAIVRTILYHQFNLQTGDGVHLTWEFNRDLAGAISELAVTTPFQAASSDFSGNSRVDCQLP